MIFKTIDSSIDSSRKSIALFNKDWNTYVSNLKNASDIKEKAISIISSNDVNCLRAYNQQIINGIKPSQAYKNTMSSCTKEAKQQAVAIAKGTITIDKATESIKKSTLAATANKIAMSAMSIALNIGTFMLISTAMSTLVSVFNELIHSEENLRQSANDLGSELSNNSSDIEGYKKKIEELKAVINDSSSSFDEVSQSRVDLMAIQDELIEKFGTEKGVIESITSAINDQTEALDELSKRAYFQTKNDFNEKTGGDKVADWLSFGNTSDDRIQSNMDKMVSAMRYSFFELETTGNEVLDNLIAKSYDLNIVEDMYGDGKHFQVYGTLDEIQNKLYGIQELSQDFDLSTGFENSFTQISNDVDDALAKYKNLYDQYVLYEKILTDKPDNQYDEQFDLINKAKEAFNEATESGNENRIKEASDEYAQTLQSAIDLAMQNSDFDVADYFKAMYPDLQQMFGEWQFNIDFEPNTNGLKDKVANALDSIDGISDGTTSFSVEDIENFNPNIATQEQIDAYGELNNVAEHYELTINQLIALLQTLGLIQSESYQKLVDTFGQENVDKLSPEDLKIAYTIENAGNMTFEELQSEIQRLKESANETSTTLSISDTISQLNTQLKPAFDSLKSAYQGIFTDEGFTLENVDLSMLDSIKSSIDELNSLEGVDINVDYSSFENLAKVLTDTTSTADDVHGAMDSLATDIVSALNPAISQCSGESYLMVQNLLESLGVMNSEEVMVSSLGYTYEEYTAAKEEAASAGFELANATESEISAFINEQGGAENCGIALATLQLKKLLVNSTSISTVSDVNQILSLANAANISANSLVALANAKAQFETASKIGDKQGMALAARGMKETSEKAKKDILNYKPVEIDFAPKGGSGNGGSKSNKDTTEEFDWIEKKIENLEEDISRLNKVADSSYSSISEKNEALAESIEKINEEIELQQQAYERYMQKAESVGLSDEYKNLVQNGDIDIEEIADEDLKEAIKNYEQWYGKAKETQDKINDLHVDAKDKHVAAYELAVSELEKLRESQAITEREYLDEMLVLYEKYYAAN